MEYSRGALVSRPFNTTEPYNPQRRLPLRPNPQDSSGSGHTRVGMAIPGARVELVPPALPPPRYNHDLGRGLDIAWAWQNQDRPDILVPIKPGSSLWGGKSNKPLIRDRDGDVDMELDVDASHSVPSTANFSSQSHIAVGNSLPSLNRRAPSPLGINQGLPGEHPLAEQNHKQSTHAYDKHLLQKIGKAHSPPKSLHFCSNDRGGSIRKISVETQGPSTSTQLTPKSISSDFVTRWMTSPASAASPNSRVSWFEHQMDSLSPTSENLSQSLTVDTGVSPPSQSRTETLLSTSELAQSPEDAENQTEQSGRNSTGYTGETESASNELGIRNLQKHERPIPVVIHGTKRRALSPLSRINNDQMQDPTPSPKPEITVGFTAPHSRGFKPPSYISTISSSQQSSLTSSNAISQSSGSMTSFSSTPCEPSIASDSVQFSSFPNRTHVQDDFGHTDFDCRSNTTLDQLNQSVTSAPANEPSATPSRVGSHYLCSCCLKKPRKFETMDQLRAHENEKQYACEFCNNRFKNKNEAERHKNSLHVRRQSWSCSALSTYEAAFSPSSVFNTRNTNTDTCGFCGDEFVNFPPDWEDRIDHLNSTHKFGECNASKKFWRADHFRQHLKHSHGGRSGKWTNILENSCLREEAPSPPEPASLSLTASEQSQSGSVAHLQPSSSNPTDAYASALQVNFEAEEEN